MEGPKGGRSERTRLKFQSDRREEGVVATDAAINKEVLVISQMV